MTTSQTFSPDWVSPPGETIVEILHERGLNKTEFIDRIGLEKQECNDLLAGRASITLTLARSLSDTLGASVEFWMARDLQYRESIERFQSEHRDWLDRLPFNDMLELGWISSPTNDSEKAAECLRFFNVSSVPEWREVYGQEAISAAFRTSDAFEANSEAVAAWLRQGERVAAEEQCENWDRAKFEKSLSEIRNLTQTKQPSRFLPELRSICAACGVAIAIVRTPEGCHASGAARFLSDDKAVVILSFRHLSDDHFWFTFFHEAAHLIKHTDLDPFIDDDQSLYPNSSVHEIEREANHFAELTLIPPEHRATFKDLPANHRKVVRFAIQIGISPGIVVGQMQHHGIIPFNYLNRLKRRYEWTSNCAHPVIR